MYVRMRERTAVGENVKLIKMYWFDEICPIWWVSPGENWNDPATKFNINCLRFMGLVLTNSRRSSRTRSVKSESRNILETAV